VGAESFLRFLQKRFGFSFNTCKIPAAISQLIPKTELAGGDSFRITLADVLVQPEMEE
jgi:hypothetical protein